MIFVQKITIAFSRLILCDWWCLTLCLSQLLVTDNDLERNSKINAVIFLCKLDA